MAALLGLLQVDQVNGHCAHLRRHANVQPVWPGMGSEIVFELYKAIKSDEADDSVGALYAAVGGTSQRGGTALLPLNVRNKVSGLTRDLATSDWDQLTSRPSLPQRETWPTRRRKALRTTYAYCGTASPW